MDKIKSIKSTSIDLGGPVSKSLPRHYTSFSWTDPAVGAAIEILKPRIAITKIISASLLIAAQAVKTGKPITVTFTP